MVSNIIDQAVGGEPEALVTEGELEDDGRKVLRALPLHLPALTLERGETSPVCIKLAAPASN